MNSKVKMKQLKQIIIKYKSSRSLNQLVNAFIYIIFQYFLYNNQLCLNFHLLQQITFIKINEMRKKKTNESYLHLPNNDLNDKCLQFKRSSPNKKTKSKPKIIPQNHHTQQSSAYYNQPLYGRKHRKQQIDGKITSNQSSTHCSLNRSKKQKNFQVGCKKTKKLRQNTIVQNTQNVKLKPEQIMSLINNYATKIQRQWRRYWFKKCLRFIVLKQRQNKQFQKYRYEDQQRNKGQKQSKSMQKLKPISRESQIIKKNSKLNVSIESQQIADSCNNLTQGYNYEKYASLQSISSRKFLQNPFINTQMNTEQKKSQKNLSQQKIQKIQFQFPKTETKNKFSSYSYSQQNVKNRLNFSRSDEKQQSNKTSQDKKKNMKIQCKIVDFQIINQEKLIQCKNIDIKTSQQKNQKLHKKQNPSIQNFLNSQENFIQKRQIRSKQKLTDDKYPYQKMFTKCKKTLQEKKLSKLLALQSKYSSNQITHRTYERFLKEVNDKHENQIKMIQIRQGAIKNSWNQVYRLYRQNSAKQNSFFEDKSQISQNHLQNSLCFDKWDFQSSAKKSISNVQSFEQFARQLNKKQQRQKELMPKNIQHVLDQLNQIQEQSEIGYKKQRINSFQKKSFAYNQEPIQKQKQDHESINILSAKKIKDDVINISIQQVPINQNTQILQNQTKQNNSVLQIQQMSKCDNQQKNIQNQNNTDVKQEKIELNKYYQQHIFIQECQQKQLSSLNKNQQLLSSQIFFKQIQFNSPKVKKKVKRLLHQYIDRSQTELNHSYEVEDQPLNGQKYSESSQFLSSQNLNIFINYQKKSPIHIQKNSYSSPQRKNSIDLQTQYLRTKFFQLTLIYFELKQKLFVKDLRQILTFCSKKKKQKKQKVQKQLKKYCSIEPNIDAVNSWLLQICHFLLDHHINQVRSNLIHIKTPPQKQLLKLVKQEKEYQKSYDTIPERLFKQFQFFNIKEISRNMEIQPSKYQNFSTLLYGFHRCLIDGLNQTLLDELIIGRKWLVLPWLNEFRCKKKIMDDHPKYCLQRAINRVSNWGQYSMGQLQKNKEMSEYQWQQYQQQKMNLIIRQETLQFPLQNEIFLSSILMKISQQVFESQMKLAVRQLLMKPL